MIKRFIAGARCPHCQQLDKIRCWREEGLYKSECVHCGVVDVMDENGKKIEQNPVQAQVIKFPPEN